MSKNINKLLQKGAMHIARERGLVQVKSEPAHFVDTDKSMLPVSGEVVLVHGQPIMKTGRVIPADAHQAAIELSRDVANLVAMSAIQESTEVAYAEALERDLSMPQKVYKIKEPNPSLTKYRKPGMRRVFKRKRYDPWTNNPLY